MLSSKPDGKNPDSETGWENRNRIIGIIVILLILGGILGAYLFLGSSQVSEQHGADILKNSKPAKEEIREMKPVRQTAAGTPAESGNALPPGKPEEGVSAPGTPQEAPPGGMEYSGAPGNPDCPGMQNPGAECAGEGNPMQGSPGHTPRHTPGHNMMSGPALQSPYHHRILSAVSKDGINWKTDEKVIFDHCSVPGAIIRKGIIYIYFVDGTDRKFGLSVAISKDNGKTFTKKAVGGRMVDPHPVLLDNGKIRLYFFGFRDGFQWAESEDGINFSDPVIAYQEPWKSMIEGNTGDDGKPGRSGGRMARRKEWFTDPDVFRTDKDWRMLISRGPSLWLLVSDNNGETFTMQKDFSWNQGGVSDTVKMKGIYRTYYGNKGKIFSATGADKGKLTTEPGIRVQAKGDFQLSSPSIIQLPDGTYRMYYVFHKFNPPPPPVRKPEEGGEPGPGNHEGDNMGEPGTVNHEGGNMGDPGQQ